MEKAAAPFSGGAKEGRPRSGREDAVDAERPDIGYAMIFPSMTIVKVIAVQVVGLIAGSGAG